jgi:hypothetical protein
MNSRPITAHLFIIITDPPWPLASSIGRHASFVCTAPSGWLGRLPLHCGCNGAPAWAKLSRCSMRLRERYQRTGPEGFHPSQATDGASYACEGAFGVMLPPRPRVPERGGAGCLTRPQTIGCSLRAVEPCRSSPISAPTLPVCRRCLLCSPDHDPLFFSSSQHHA